MKTFTATISLLCISWALLAQTSVMTFNIRYDNPGDNNNQWNNRKEDVAELINDFHPDIFGIQEGLYHQVQYLLQQTNNYSFIGVGRSDGKTKGEYTALLYDTTKYSLINHKTFWLSETPNRVSIGWDAAMERICTYGVFKDKRSKEEIHIFNAHLDHRGIVARPKSAELIIDKIKQLQLNNARIVVMGDFNSRPKKKAIRIMKKHLQDSRKFSKNINEGPEGTFNNFKDEWDTKRRIDYIFVKNFTVTKCKHIDQKRKNNLWFSDHLPVLVTLKSP